MTRFFRIAFVFVFVVGGEKPALAARHALLTANNQGWLSETPLRYAHRDADRLSVIPAPEIAFPAKPDNLSVADLDGDGRDDLVTTFQFGLSTLSMVGLNRSRLTATDGETWYAPMLDLWWDTLELTGHALTRGDLMMRPQVAAVDGKDVPAVFSLVPSDQGTTVDLQWFLPDPGVHGMRFLLSELDLTALYPGQRVWPSLRYVDDVNDDGLADLIASVDIPDGTIHTYAHLGTEFPEVLLPPQRLAGEDILRLGDFDGDGRSDRIERHDDQLTVRVAYRTKTGDFLEPEVVADLTQSIKAELRDGVTGEFLGYSIGGRLDLVVVGDFDGDGQDDAAWFEERTDMTRPTPRILYSDGRGQPFVARPLETGIDLTVAMLMAIGANDLDHDGKDELIMVGWDSDFGQTVGPFVRVISGADRDPRVISNTKLPPITEETYEAPPDGYNIAFGNFFDLPRPQILALNRGNLDAALYVWNPCDAEQRIDDIYPGVECVAAGDDTP